MRQTILIMITVCTTIIGCGAQEKEVADKTPIASKQGFNLTEENFKTYLTFVEKQTGETSTLKTQVSLKSALKQAFLEDPERILLEIQELKDSLEQSAPRQEHRAKDPNTPEKAGVATNLGEGHMAVRKLLGTDIGQMQFNTEAANTFRDFLSNSLLSTESTNSYDGGVTYSKATVQFCPDGSYLESRTGYVGIDVEGMSGSSGTDTDYIPGYWEVATLPNGTHIILFYSTHPLMLEDAPNGILPFPVGKHSDAYVLLPNGDGYHRTVSYCQ